MAKPFIRHFFQSSIQAIKVRYFEDTDALFIGFRDADIAESRGLDGNTALEVDAKGNVCAITFEHEGQCTDVSQLTVEGIAV
jgi:uncharacterized protein YuzE